MMISYNSQLGLRFKEKSIKMIFFNDYHDCLSNKLSRLQESRKEFEEKHNILSSFVKKQESGVELTEEEKSIMNKLLSEEDGIIAPLDNQRKIKDIVCEALGNKSEIVIVNEKQKTIENNCLASDAESSYYFICDSVYKCAELIKIKENFTGRTLKDINFGKYTYLLGKNKMLRFVVGLGAIAGFYYDDKKKDIFWWGIETNDGKYYFDEGYDKIFSWIMQILTFVELGDIEIKILEGGKNNGGKKNEDKIHNSSNKTVYVVDSTWNKIIMRTTGFAVRGHFRLQACGEGLKDRKLIWIDAFEKLGYKRKPKAEIVR